MRAGGPDFLAVDDPVVPVTFGAGAQAGDVRAGRGFGEQLAPNFLALQGGGDVTLKLFWLGIGHHGGDAHAEADFEHAARHGVGFLLLVVDDLEQLRRFAAAPFLRPGEAGEPGGVFFALPFLGALDFLRADAAAARAVHAGGFKGGVGGQEGADFGAERGLGGRIVKIHDRISLSCVAGDEFVDHAVPPERDGPHAQCQAFGAAVIEMAVRFPGETDAAMGLDVFLGGEVVGIRR